MTLPCEWSDAGFIIGVVRGFSGNPLIDSLYGDVLLAATAEYREWIKEGRKLPF